MQITQYLYMKILIISIVALSGCSIELLPVIEAGESVEEIVFWIYSNIEYVADTDENGHSFQTPQETLDLRTGDCEDFAILTIWIIEENLGIDAEFVTVWVPTYIGRIKNDGQGTLHALVEAEGMWWDATQNRKYMIDEDRRIF